MKKINQTKKNVMENLKTQSGAEVISINFNPTEAQINNLTSIQTFVDTIVLVHDLSPNQNGFIKQNRSDDANWQWAIVSIGERFKFPVPIIADEHGNVNLYDWQSNPTSFTKEEAALVLTKYYILLFSFHNSIGDNGLSNHPVLKYPFSLAKNWMASLGGEEEMLNYIKIINAKIMEEPAFCGKAYNVLD